LTPKEKIGQMTQIEVGKLVDCNGYLNKSAVEYWIDEWKVGSFLETPGNHGGRYSWYSPHTFANFTDAVQRIALEKGPKLPVLWGLDSVRGANYVKGAVIFPAGIATAASFDPHQAYAAGRIAAKDTRAAGVHWAFAPVLDLGVNKLWPRCYENFGEDPYLSSQMAVASVHGFQGDYKKDRTRVAACMKHFIGYGYPFDGSDRANRHIARNELLEYYVPPFQAAIDAGVATAMESYSTINGRPVVLSRYYLQELLRDQLGFKGMLVTDWEEINSQATIYKTAKDYAQATTAALNRTSIDMSMVPDDESFSQITLDLVSNGTVPMSRLDESVMRILQLKKDLGLFDQPFADESLQETVGSAQDIEAGRNAARESITLLKNKNSVLPLSTNESVLFLGPTLNSTRYMGGGWNVHWQGPSEQEGDSVYEGLGDTVLRGVKAITGSDPKYLKGVDIDGKALIDTDAVIAAARSADKIVIGLGEHTYAEIVGNIENLALPHNQLKLVEIVARESQKPVVVVLIEGRARGLGRIPEIADGIIDAYLPGIYGGQPIAEVLYGKVNPSGRLPFTYPGSESQASSMIWQASYVPYTPQWPFGYGLGYSNLTYSNFTLSSNVLRVGSPVTATVSIANNGPHAQKEPVLLFTHQQYRFDAAPDLYRLRAFTKVELAVGESKQVSFTIKAE
ncbi:putative lysosomal beta glucosidase, partial [Martensiomyces pterosporus]